MGNTISTETVQPIAEPQEKESEKPLLPPTPIWSRRIPVADWKDDNLADWIVQIKNHEFHLHSSVLAASSSWFLRLFTSHFQGTEAHSHSVVLDLPEETIPYFPIVLDYIYSNKLELTVENAVSVRRIAEQYQFDELLDLVDQFIESTLNESNSMLFLIASEQLSQHVIADRAREVFALQMDSIPIGEICDLPAETVVRLLTHGAARLSPGHISHIVRQVLVRMFIAFDPIGFVLHTRKDISDGTNSNPLSKVNHNALRRSIQRGIEFIVSQSKKTIPARTLGNLSPSDLENDVSSEEKLDLKEVKTPKSTSAKPNFAHFRRNSRETIDSRSNELKFMHANSSDCRSSTICGRSVKSRSQTTNSSHSFHATLDSNIFVSSLAVFCALEECLKCAHVDDVAVLYLIGLLLLQLLDSESSIFTELCIQKTMIQNTATEKITDENWEMITQYHACHLVTLCLFSIQSSFTHAFYNCPWSILIPAPHRTNASPLSISLGSTPPTSTSALLSECKCLPSIYPLLAVVNVQHAAELLQSEYLSVPQEDVVFEAVKHYIAHHTFEIQSFPDNEKGEIDQLNRLWSYIKLSQLSWPMLVNAEMNPYIPRDLLSEAMAASMLRHMFSCGSAESAFEKNLVLLGKSESIIHNKEIEMSNNIPNWEEFCQGRTTERSSRLAHRSNSSNQCILVVGGKEGKRVNVSTEVFYVATNKWQKGPDLSTPRSGCAVVALGESVYIIGGYDGISFLNSIERMHISRMSSWLTQMKGSSKINSFSSNGSFKVQSNKSWYESKSADSDMWELSPSMKHKRAGHAAVILGNSIYVIGGTNDTRILRSVERFDVETQMWFQVASMHERRKGCAAAVLDGFLYVMGGFDGHNSLTSVERYDSRQDRWYDVSPMPIPRVGCGVCQVQGMLVVVGGKNDDCLNTSVIYNPEHDHWSKMPDLQKSRAACAAIAIGGKVVVIGGYDEQQPRGSGTWDDAETYDWINDEWTLLISMQYQRSFFGATGFQFQGQSPEFYRDTGIERFERQKS